MRKLTFFCACLFLAIPCVADTFTHHRTGESFNGYAVQRKKGNKTQVRVEGKPPQYLDLSAYEIRYNYLGRKNKIFIFSIKDSIDFICETEAFEKAIGEAANQGPLFILIEIDTPGGRIDLTKRICAAITKIDNCRTVAFVNGGKFNGGKPRILPSRNEKQTPAVGGAFSAGAIIALACDNIYMREGTSIGAATVIVTSSSGITDLKSGYGETVGEKMSSAWRAYCSAVAEHRNRPGLLAKAMVDKDIEILEVVENGERFFIELKNKKPTQSVVRILSDKGSLLTLTAGEAVQCGIADKVVASRDELFADLSATKATLIRDTATSKARREFEQDEQKFKKILLSITSLEEQAATFAKEVAALEEIISRDHKVIYHNGIWSDGWYRATYSEREEQYNPTAINEFFEKGDQCLKVLRALKKDYEKALLLAKKHPDLHHHVRTIEKGLNFCRSYI
ncbi:hypothetical protein ES703_42695 [subsurface metagenome]